MPATLFIALFMFLTSCDKSGNNPVGAVGIDEVVQLKSSQKNIYEEGVNHIELTGEDNMRDLGGYVGFHGKRILYGKLFRSGELSGLTEADKEKLTSLGIKNVIDLRTDAEIEGQPDNLPEGIMSYQLPLIEDLGAGSSLNDLMKDILSGKEDARDFMMPLYSTIDSIKMANWRKAFDIIEQGEPTLWHCTAGKDRAGMTTAILLYVLGVDSETIVEDFMKSNDYLEAYINGTIAYINSTGANGELMRPLLGVEEEYIQAFFDAVDTQFGSMDKFVKDLHINQGKLRELYLEK